jgi:hypothetical protein
MKWQRAASCNTDHQTGNCAEVMVCGEKGIHIRSSLDPQIQVHLDWDEWDTFRDAIKAGDFDNLAQ